MNKMLEVFSLDIIQSIIEQNPDPTLIFAPDGEILEVNPAATKTFGYLKEELVGVNFQNFLITNHENDEFHPFNQWLKGISLERELPITSKHRGVIQTIAKGIPLTSKGNIIGVFCVIKDTEVIQKEKKESLAESEKRYRLLADNSLDLIQLVNLDGVITYASPSHKTVLGYDPEEYVGKWVFYQPNGELDEVFKNTFLNMALTHTSFSCEVVRKHQLGYDVWIEMTGKPMFDETGTFEHMMLVGHEITERKEHEKQLEHLSYHDPLTGISNRRLLKERLDQAIMNGTLQAQLFAVLYIDIDHFKRINDNYGHDAGNELLIQFVARVKTQLRESDTFARQGGDEFTVLLREINNEDDAYRIAENILACMKKTWKIGRDRLELSSSIGISFYPKDGQTSDQLIKLADKALYEAKADGRNSYKSYSYKGESGLLFN